MSFVYRMFCRIVELLVLCGRRERSKDVEILALRHQRALRRDGPCTSGCAGLLVWIGSRLGLLLGDIAIPLRAPRALVGFIQVTPSLGVTLLAVAHRQGHQQHYEHDRDRDNDHDRTGADREHGDKGSAQIPPSPSSMPKWPRGG